MSMRMVALVVAFLMSVSVSDAQTPSAYGGSELGVCAPPRNDYAKKQAELVKVQTRISNLMGAIAVLREGITQQQDIVFDGKKDAATAGLFGVAKVTKAMSDTILNIAQPIAPHVKKAYDAADLLVSASYALSEGKGAQASANGLNAVQNVGDAYDEYLKRQKGMVIRPGKMETPGVVGSAVKGADDLRRGDYAGTASNVATGVVGLLDSKAKKSKSGLRAVSSGFAMVADTPGKTDDSRFADGLGALSEVSKLAARAAQDREAYAIAGMAGRAGRILGYSGVMLEQVSNAKQGLADTASMVDQYNAIDERSTGTQKKMQRQIDSKLEEIGKLRAKEHELQLEMNKAVMASQPCRQTAPTKLAASTPKPVRATPYVWDRQASRVRLERAKQAYDRARVAQQPPPVPTASVASPVATAAGPAPAPAGPPATPTDAWYLYRSDSVCSKCP